jgi:hypothetical protein
MTDTTKGVLLSSDVIKSIVTEAGLRCVDASKGETIDCVHASCVVQALHERDKCLILTKHYGDNIAEIIQWFDVDALLKPALDVALNPIENNNETAFMALGLRDRILGNCDLLEDIIEPYVAHNHLHGWG